jgi:hypothetical protein
MSPFPFFEDFLLGAFRGAAEQLATATAGAFTTMPGRESGKISHHKLQRILDRSFFYALPNF